MAKSFDDSVLDFDLNFLNHAPKNIVPQNRHDKQREAIILAKKKTLATDLLIRRYYERKETLEETERALLDSKEECKQMCIEYKNVSEKLSLLENENTVLKNNCQELRQKCLDTQSQFGAIQSHANQLQLLVKEKEELIETLKLESKLEKSTLSKGKRQVTILKRKNIALLQNISSLKDVVFGKKKLNDELKAIFNKFETVDKAAESEDSDSGAEQNDTAEWNDASDSPKSPDDVLKGVELLQFKNDGFSVVKAVHKGRDNDEAISVDTGRGSSLAFSDSEKCFQSPEYFINDSPVNNQGNRQRSVATSPIPIHLTTTSTSPIKIHDHNKIDTATSKNKNRCLSQIEKIIPVITIDRALSPIMFAELKRKAIEIATSPIFFEDSGNLVPDIKTSDNIEINHENNNADIQVHAITIDEDVNDDSSHSLISNQDEDSRSPVGFKGFSYEEINNATKPFDAIEKHCLEINNSNIVCDENSSDNEIEMILDSMRFKEKMITPIPMTPVRQRKVEKSESMEAVKVDTHLCQEAVKAREENKIIHESIALLAKEIMCIKSMLQKNRMSDESIHEEDHIICNLEENNSSKALYEPPIPTSLLCPDSPANDGYNCIEQPVENLDLDPPIETCNITQPIETLDVPLSVKKPKSSPVLNQHANNVTENEVTSEHNTNIILNLLQFEDASGFFEDTDETQNNFESTNPNVTRCDSDEINDARTEHNASQDLISCTFKVPNMNEESSNKESQKHKEKPRKLSRLEKMRKNLAPKNKIKDAISPAKRSSRSNVNKVSPTKKVLTPNNRTKKVVTDQDNSATLNDKDVYEKALKVMAEIKSQQKDKPSDRANTNKVNKLNKSLENTSADAISNKNVPTKTIPEKNYKKTPLKATKNNDVLDFSDSNNIQSTSPIVNSVPMKPDNCNENITEYEIRRCRKRSAAETEVDFKNKRILRSSLRQSQNERISSVEKYLTVNNMNENVSTDKENPVFNITDNGENTINDNTKAQKVEGDSKNNSQTEDIQNKKIDEPARCSHPKYSLFCHTIENYASLTGRRQAKKCKESVINNVCKKIEDAIARINELSHEETKPAMNKFANELRNWKLNNFLSGLMKYFKNPERKVEMFNKINCFPAPPMTKSEQTLVYVLNLLESSNPWNENNVICRVLDAMEYTMFQLNNTPEFDVVESMSHFYAVLCRFKKAKSRLRLFVLDAMYCIQFKSIPLIKQCIEVWMHILPLAHMATAQNTLVICLVYLLHFYKCEDRFKRVSEMRMILQKKYFFEITEWNDHKILEMFRKSVKQLKDVPIERKMLRIALIILAKRLGPKWCQNNIIKNLLLPLIENANIPQKTKEFCVSMLGPLMRPYPTEMKIHCEIVINLLLDMLHQNPTPPMEEAIFTSLLYIQHRNFNRIIQELISWNPPHVSLEFEELLKDFVKSKPVKLWKGLLSKVHLN